MKHIIFLLLLFVITQPLMAQTIPQNSGTVDVSNLSDSQLQKIMMEIQNRGLTQEEAMTLARAQGASQLQIDQLMVRMQRPQSPLPDTLSVNKNPNLKPTSQRGESGSPKSRGTISEKTKKIFGYQLFNSDKLTFEPDVNIPIPQNYILGIGDQLMISVWGASQTKYTLTIDKTGAIIIPDVGPVFLSGKSIEQAQSLIKNGLKAIYNGMSGDNPNVWAEVSIGGVRSIKINVLGEINAPGTYSLPSTASAFNALYLSGGPNENGSFREIRVIRDGVTFKTIDVYDFLIKADPAANVQLREQDILFVPPYENRVEIDGEVKRKGFFEIKKKETLSDLILFAGGFGEKAYSRSLKVVRNNDREHEIRSVPATDFAKFILQNGDVVTADSILNRFSNRVSIIGAVFHPGNYEFTPGMKLSDLIRQADGLREDAFLNRGLIERMKDDYSPENISFDLKEIVQGKNDLFLKKEDKIVINSIFQLREERKVSIKGEVIRPESYDYQDNMTLNDLIFKAGGFKEEADPSVIEVSRKLSYEQSVKVNDKMNEILQFALSRDLKLSTADAAFKLQPFDEVYVRRAPGYRDQGTFMITGEVVYTGTYTIMNKNEKISDAIKRAGGLVPGAFLNGATLTRAAKLSTAEIEKKKQLMKLGNMLKDTLSSGNKTYPVGIELGKILAEPGGNFDLLLQPGDIINIPRELQTVKVSGDVMNPVALTYEKRLSLRQYIDRAGGYNELARKSKTYVIYPNGTTASTRGFIFKRIPRLTPGAEIIVPRKPEKKGSDNAMKWVSIASGLSSLSIALITLINLVK